MGNKDSDQLYRELNINVYWKDVNGNYTGCNDIAAESVGLKPSQLIGKTDYDLFPRHIAAEYEKNDKKVISHCDPLVFYEVAPAAQSSKGCRVLLSSKSPHYNDSGKVAGVIGVTIDTVSYTHLTLPTTPYV